MMGGLHIEWYQLLGYLPNGNSIERKTLIWNDSSIDLSLKLLAFYDFIVKANHLVKFQIVSFLLHGLIEWDR